MIPQTPNRNSHLGLLKSSSCFFSTPFSSLENEANLGVIDIPLDTVLASHRIGPDTLA